MSDKRIEQLRKEIVEYVKKLDFETASGKTFTWTMDKQPVAKIDFTGLPSGGFKEV